MLKGAAREIRRCQAFKDEGWGEQCKAWAKHYTNYCNKHSPPEIIDNESRELNKELAQLFPKLYKKKKYRCKCSAYTFPHFIATGICNWPDPPTHRFIPPRILPLVGNPEKEAKELLRRLGIKNKYTSFIKRFRMGKVVPIKTEELRSEDFTLLEDYLKDYVELEDWSSLPIQEKRRRIKEQMIRELKKEVERKEAYKQCLKPNSDKELFNGGSEENIFGAKKSKGVKTIKEKIRLRNGEIIEKHYMILDGEKIPLE